MSSKAFQNSKKLNGIVSVLQFGAVGDGTTNDTAAVLAALQSGSVVDGGGLTYAVSGTLQPSSFKGLRNCTLKQTNQAGVLACVTLYIKDISNFIIENVVIDRGTNVYANSAYDSNLNGALNYVFGLKVEGSTGTYSTNFKLENVEVYGNGSGNGIGLWWCNQFNMYNCYVHDMNARRNPGAPGDQDDDFIQGIWLSNCENGSLDACRVSRIFTWNGSTYTNIAGRGFAFGNVRNCTIANCIASNIDQCWDYTGTGDGVDGNRFLSISNCFADLGASVGFKFANACHDIVVTGCTALRCGYYGFFVSGMKDATTSIPERVDFVGCQAINTGFATGRPSPSYRAGFYISREPEVDNYQPRAIRFLSCFVKDTQTPKTTQIGFWNSVFPIEYPQAGYDKNYANVAVNCYVDAGITPFNQISPNICQSRSSVSQSIPNATWTAIDWNDDAYDNTGLHNVSANNAFFYIKSPGWYRIEASVQFSANPTGGRLGKIQINGTDLDTSIMNNIPIAGQAVNAFTCATRFLNSGDSIRVFVYQNSGGTLGTVAGESICTVQRVEG